MSYPYGPNDNPYSGGAYGQQPTQPGGYGYPRQPQPYGQFGGGAPAPDVMPGKVTAVRVMMFVAGGLQTALMLLLLVGLSVASRDLEATYSEDFEVGLGVVIAFAGVCVVHGVLGIALATQFNRGGNGVRISSVVWASVVILLGLIGLVFTVGIAWIALGVVCVVLLSHQETNAWFRRY